MIRRDLLALLGGLLAGSAVSAGEASGGRFEPKAPVRLVVPNEPGGGMDIVARLLVSSLARLWSPYNVVVEYHPGAGTALGTQHVARSRPDGHTLGIIATPHVINPSIRPLAFDPEKDLTPVCRIGTADLLLSCAPAFEAASLAEAIARARAHPGKYNCATAGTGSAMHFTLEMLKQRAGLDLVHVPFKGAGPAFIEVAEGRIEFLVEPVFSSLPHVKAGRLKPLATTGRRRSRQLPQIPTLAESLPGFHAESFFGLVAPGGLDPSVAERIHRDVIAAMSAPEVASRIEAIGIAASPMGPTEFADFLSSEIRRWREVAKAAGLSAN